MEFDDNGGKVYAIDVAFHESGLNYGSKEETITRVVKKCIRTAMCIYGYLGFKDAEIIFASPKISTALMAEMTRVFIDINNILQQVGLNYRVRCISNNDFKDNIIYPVFSLINNVADTSELFMRSLQLYLLVEGMQPPSPLVEELSCSSLPSSVGITEAAFSEMKIGKIVRTQLRDILEQGRVSKDEVEKMQEKIYSKDVFHIQYPVLLRADGPNDEKPERYYSGPLNIFGVYYFLCSEWYENPEFGNNARPYLIKWLKTYAR